MDGICPYCGTNTLVWRHDFTDGEHGELWEHEYDECTHCHAIITGADWRALEDDAEITS